MTSCPSCSPNCLTHATPAIFWLDFDGPLTGGAEALVVDAPVLTPREVRNLSRQLPSADGGVPSSPGVADTDARSFADLYRQYPLYAQVELL